MDGRARTAAFNLEWVRPQIEQSMPAIQRALMDADYYISNIKTCMYRPGESEPVPGAFITYDLPSSIADLSLSGSQNTDGRVIELVALNKRLVDFHNDWPAEFHFTGFWQDPAPVDPPVSDGLRRFLSNGSKPVIVTMGSMEPITGPELTRSLIQAVRSAGHRAVIIGSDPAVLGPSDNTIHFESEVPYGWLFPQACCVIHHGGMGTVAAALTAGVQSIVLPQILDQHRIGWVLMNEGLATGIYDSRKLDQQSVINAIRAASDPKRIQRSKAWQKELSKDRGVAAAVDLIEQHWEQLLASGKVKRRR